MRCVALIPARGGSKRLPRKNILDFMGKPIIAWTIEAALETGVFERVIVSTEDQEIADIAAAHGAQVDMRDPELATDQAQVREVCHDFLTKEKEQGRKYDIFCCLYATSPLRTAADIMQVVNLVKNEGVDYALATTEYDLPPHQALVMNENGDVTPKWPELVSMRASDVGELVVDNGSTYAVSAEQFLKTKSFYGEHMKVHRMPKERSCDIDEERNFEIAKLYAQKLIDIEAA